jgi:hypothetical protein
MEPKKDNDSKVKWSFRLYCVHFFLLDLVNFIDFVYEMVYKVL